MNTIYTPARFDETTPYQADHDILHTPPLQPTQVSLWQDYSPKSTGPKYPPHDMNASILGGQDLAGLLAATIMALGPLSAYALGFGL